MNREEYLLKAVVELGYIFDRYDYELPEVHVSCSWPGGGSANKRIGECWSRSASQAGINEIFISPLIDQGDKALEILAHELIHAVDDCKHGHRKQFTQIMKKIGLAGKPTATHAGERLHDEIAQIVELLGEYPHSKLSPPAPKQKSRQLKATCDECGAVWRMSKKWLEQAAFCPVCGEQHIIID